MKIFRIINNNTYLEKDGKYYPTTLIKFFDGDKLLDHQLFESEIRKRILVGYFSTSDKTRYGKSNSGKSIYLVKPFMKLPSFLIPYGGILKGEIVIRFKFTNWNKKLPSGEIVDVIGNKNNISKNQLNLKDSIDLSKNQLNSIEKNNFSMLEKTLLFNYNIYPKNIKIKPEINPLEKSIIRKDLTHLKSMFSVDDIGCQDRDDAISIMKTDEYIIIGVHIAQPIYWLDEKIIKKTCETKFSTLYLDKYQKNLWGKEITKLSSLNKNEKKPAYSVVFKIHKEIGRIIKTYEFKSWISNKATLSYDDNHIMLERLSKITKGLNEELNESIKDNHDLISFWMKKTNHYIGQKIKDSGLPFRVNKINQINNNYDKDINEIFHNRNSEKAYYSTEEIEHQSLGLSNYVHFTSPIRRIIDTIIHYYLTYNIKIKIDIDKLNYIDSHTKKFHRMLEMKKIIKNINNNSEHDAYIYQMKRPNIFEVFIKKIGFVNMELFNNKINYQFEFIFDDNKYIIKNDNIEFKYTIGQKIKVKFLKKDDFLPYDCFKIIPI